MTLVNSDLAYFPAYHMILGATTEYTFDANATNSDLLALVFQIPRTGTINKIHYRIGAKTSPVMTHRMELRTVSTSTGLPDTAGTLYGSSTSITVDASTYTANTNYTAAVAATATAGNIAAIVSDLSAYTSGSFGLVRRVSTWPGDAASSGRYSSLPYEVFGNSPSAAGKNSSGNPPQGFVLEYSGGVFVPIAALNAWCGVLSNTTLSSSATVRAGNKFTPRSPRRAIGIYADSNFTGGVVYRLRLASDDSVLATATPNKDILAFATQGQFFTLFDAGATVTLAAGTAYYVTMEATDTTGGVINHLGSGVSQAMLDVCPGGQNFYGVTYASGSYTEYLTANAVRRYGIGLITDQEDDGTGGGGGGGRSPIQGLSQQGVSIF